MSWHEWFDGRGHPSEHDPGPPKNRRWARLFAEVPNYRGLGVAVTGRESFRWHFGPMFYRGRLGDGQVKVLIVGQEGAQDESLSHRSFTGGTGARMQHGLNHVGITRSYLFLNTFCYPIFGQYGGHLRWLAQDPASPIVRHRHEVFDYVVDRNDLQLVIAVGTAAKESVATWFESHGVTADPRRLHTASAEQVSPRLRAIGVMHPGGAASGGTAAIKKDFQRAMRQIERWRRQDADWLIPDPDGVPGRAADYRYRSAPIPFRDFPFGTSWRLGRGSTSSNRKDGQRSIQLFSAAGKYNGRGHNPHYRSVASGDDRGYAAESGDLAYEPPRHSYRVYDKGPDPAMARLLMPDWPDMDGAVCHPSLGFGAIYRGRLDDVTMLLLADSASVDDLFTGRALTGEAGQHIQAWMATAGIDHRYLILRVPPFDPTGASAAQRRAWVDHPETVNAYSAIVEQVRGRSRRLGPIVAIGTSSRRLAGRLGLEAIPMTGYRRRAWTTDWNRALADLKGKRYRKDRRASFVYDGRRGQIPRTDLPFGTLRWQGTSGSRGVAGLVGGHTTGDYYKLFVPRWVFDLDPAPLSRSERKAIDDA